MNHTALNRENTQLLQKKSPRKKIGSDFLFLGLKLLVRYFLANFENSLKICYLSKIGI